MVLTADAHLTRDTPALTAAQIVAHHNLLLDGFAAGIHAIKVVATAEIAFGSRVRAGRVRVAYLCADCALRSNSGFLRWLCRAGRCLLAGAAPGAGAGS